MAQAGDRALTRPVQGPVPCVTPISGKQPRLESLRRAVHRDGGAAPERWFSPPLWSGGPVARLRG